MAVAWWYLYWLKIEELTVRHLFIFLPWRGGSTAGCRPGSYLGQPPLSQRTAMFWTRGLWFTLRATYSFWNSSFLIRSPLRETQAGRDSEDPHSPTVLHVGRLVLVCSMDDWASSLVFRKAGAGSPCMHYVPVPAQVPSTLQVLKYTC